MPVGDIFRERRFKLMLLELFLFLFVIYLFGTEDPVGLLLGIFVLSIFLILMLYLIMT